MKMERIMAMVPLEMEEGSDFGHKHAYLLRKTGSANLEQTKRSWLGYVMQCIDILRIDLRNIC